MNYRFKVYIAFKLCKFELASIESTLQCETLSAKYTKLGLREGWYKIYVYSRYREDSLVFTHHHDLKESGGDKPVST